MAVKVVRAFLADAPGRMAQIKAATSMGDAERLRKAAHAMKSSSANVGAKGLAATCSELEEMGRGGTIDGATLLLSRAESELARVLVALHAQIDESLEPAFA